MVELARAGLQLASHHVVDDHKKSSTDGHADLVRRRHLTSDGRKAQQLERVGAMTPDADPETRWPGAFKLPAKLLTWRRLMKWRSDSA